MDIKNNILYIGRIEEEDEGNEEDGTKKEVNEEEEEINQIDQENQTDDEKEKIIPKEKKKTTEKVVFLGSMEDNENFEEDPKIENGALYTLVEATEKHKTNIYEVNKY